MRRLLVLVLAVAAIAAPALQDRAPVPVAHRGNHITAKNWEFSYWRSSTDGLVVTGGTFRGRRVFERISVPQCRVHYFQGSATMNDNLGRDGNIHYVAGTTKLSRSPGAVEIRATYQCCHWPRAASYRYKVRYIFYTDGRFRPYVYAYGPGLETRATYECSIRADLDIGGGDGDGFQVHKGSLWRLPATEGGFRDDGDADPFSGGEWMTWDGTTIYYLKPNPADPGARVYALAERAGEGGSDLGWLVARPADFDEDEEIQGGDLVLWYVSMTPYRRPRGCVGHPARCDPERIGPALILSAPPRRASRASD